MRGNHYSKGEKLSRGFPAGISAFPGAGLAFPGLHLAVPARDFGSGRVSSAFLMTGMGFPQFPFRLPRTDGGEQNSHFQLPFSEFRRRKPRFLTQ